MKDFKTQILPLLRTEKFVKEIENIYGAKIYVVGGAVRDYILRKEIKDIDLIVTGVPLDTLHNILSKYGKINLVGESFAITKLKLSNWDEDFDISIPRTERKIKEGHTGFEIEFSHELPLKEDLVRRDFTCNALAMEVSSGVIIDYFSGLKHIQDNVLEMVSPSAFKDDALRMLRAIQFAARFNFTLSDNLFKSIFTSRKTIKEITGERILEEFEKIINKNGNMPLAFKLLESTGLMKEITGNYFRKEVLPLETRLDFYFNLLNHKGKLIGSFFKNTLKGDAKTAYDLEVMMDIFEDFDKINKTDNINPIFVLRRMIFEYARISERIFETTVLPVHVLHEMDEFKKGFLPKNMNEVNFNGKDVMEILDIEEGPRVGLIMKDIVKEILETRLSNNFNEIKKFVEDLKQPKGGI